jgi:hypothetical protein
MTVLAWMPLWKSALLSTCLTVLVFVLVWRKIALWLVAFVSIAMIWRGEAWKAVFLLTNQELSELRQSQQKGLSNESSAISYGQTQSIARADELNGGVQSRLAEEKLDFLRPGREAPSQADALERKSPNTSVNLRPINPLAFSAQYFRDISKRGLAGSLGEPTEPTLEKPYSNGPSTLRFHMTYIV